MPAPHSRIRAAFLALMTTLALAACAGSSSPSPTTGVPSQGPSAVPGGASEIVLERMPANAACDAIGVGYRSVTFFIDPTARPNVWAVTDQGARLAVLWDASFVGGPLLDPSVKDKAGAIVVRNRDVLATPQGAWPNLHGHFACPGLSSLWVFDAPPQ